MDNTIVAISTAAGNSGIGIIRLSGEKCFEIISKIFKPKNKNEIKGYSIKYGNIVNPKNNEILDEVLVSCFIGPKSYTKEDMCEINSHGGMVIEKQILNLCLENGAEMAEPGEFTRRAFLNGRIDLTQAESIIDLINSKSEIEAKESINQLNGRLSKKIEEISKELMEIMIKIEVNIDYPEYDVEEVTNTEAYNSLKNTLKLLKELEKSFDRGKLLKDGVRTVIFGKPNAGKSSLLNTILNEDRAIVSSVEGTTRDTIEEFIDVDGISLKLIDTAGIRSTNNEIEKIGVDKSMKMANDADLIIAIFDYSSSLTKEDESILDFIKDKKAIIVLNKVDIRKENKNIDDKINELCKPIIKISALNGEGISELYKEIIKMYNFNNMSNDNNILITNIRHKNQISKSIKNVESAMNSIKDNMPVDVSSIYIKQAMDELGEITGQNISEDIINEIFKRFCLGK